MSLKKEPTQKRVILLTTAEDDSNKSQTLQANNDIENLQHTRRLSRGFTITVSPPVTEYTPIVTLNDGQHSISERSISHSSSGITVESFYDDNYDELLPRRRNSNRYSDDYLAPDELIPSVGLDHTVSRLPSLDDMLADDQLKKMLNTSEIHREVQNLIVVDCDYLKYQNLIILVQKSFENNEWRKSAALDKGLIDTLILLIRQRLIAARNPHQTPGSDFMPKASKNFNSIFSKSFGSKANSTVNADHSTLTPLQQPTSTELLVKSAIHLAILAADVKLIRNICVDVQDCQLYLHEHRIIDLLVDHIDMFMEIIYHSRDVMNSNKTLPGNCNSSTLFHHSIQHTDFPEWAYTEIESFPRALFQLITNVASGHIKIQRHVFQYIFPNNLLNIIILSEDISVIFSLLHCLINQLDTSTVYQSFIEDQQGVKALYFLLASVSTLINNDSRNVPEERSSELQKCITNAIGFFRNFLTRKYELEHENLFTLLKEFLIKLIEHGDPHKYISTATKTLRHAASFKTSYSGILSNRRISYDIPIEWSNFVSKKAQSVLKIQKSKVVSTFLFIINEALNIPTYTEYICQNITTLQPIYQLPTNHCAYTILMYISMGCKKYISVHFNHTENDVNNKTTLLTNSTLSHHNIPSENSDRLSVWPNPNENSGISDDQESITSTTSDRYHSSIEVILHDSLLTLLQLFIHIFSYSIYSHYTSIQDTTSSATHQIDHSHSEFISNLIQKSIHIITHQCPLQDSIKMLLTQNLVIMITLLLWNIQTPSSITFLDSEQCKVLINILQDIQETLPNEQKSFSSVIQYIKRKINY